MKKFPLFILFAVIATLVLSAFFQGNKGDPEISLRATKNEAGGWDLLINTDHFDMVVATSASKAVVPLQGTETGHIHLFVDNKLVALISEKEYHLNPLPSGDHKLTVTLNQSNHAQILANGKSISDSITITSSENGSLPPEINLSAYGSGNSVVNIPHDPKSEIYTHNTWKTGEIMLVVERDRGSLVAINGATQETLGRITGLGTQLHTMVFSPDNTYAFVISRDGWLTKIDLKKLFPVRSVKVGDDSRGTAITDSGNVVAIGNYAPQTLVLVNAQTLDTLATIDLVDTRSSSSTRSRAGAVLETGENIAVALKDVNAVWIIDTKSKGYPITHRFSDVGSAGGIMHDGFSTPDGRYLVFSIEKSNTVWVLDTKEMKGVAEIKTGKKPHTGPGASWGGLIYIPSLEEEVVNVIDSKTWTLVTQIKTNSPGLFPRSYSGNTDYPYVWVDTFLPGKSDEVYVIDGRNQKIIKTLVPIPGKMVIHPEFSLDGKWVYVAVTDSNQVFVYDAHTFDLVTTISAVTPTGIFNAGLRAVEPGL